MKRFLLKTILLSALSLGVFGVLFAFHPAAHVFAQTTSEGGLETVGAASGLGQEDVRIVIAKVIRIVLSFLGVLAVVIVLYGGFVWMTAAGNDEKVARAKKILVNGGIGLVLILLSWTIVTFIIGALLQATGGQGGNGTGDTGVGGGLGGGSSSAPFSVTAIVPKGQVPIRNVKPRITFSRNVDVASVTTAGRLVVTNVATGNRVQGTLDVFGNVATFTPSSPCPDPNSDRGCFDANTEFSVTVSSDIKSSSGQALACSNALPCTGTFTTGELVDVENPRADVTLPDEGDAVSSDSLVGVQVLGTDDSMVSSAAFAVGDTSPFDTVPASGEDLTNVTIETLWDTTGLQNGARYKISATVFDIAGNSDTDSVTVRMRPSTCFNGIQDTDLGETGVDCGGESNNVNYCGACTGSTCTDSGDCGVGLCIGGVCTAYPVIQSLSPASGAPGTFVTITGDDFGAKEGRVLFLSASGLTVASVPLCAAPWSNREITVQVPSDAISGPITVTTADGLSEKTNDDRGPLLDDFVVNDVQHPNLCKLSPTSGASTDLVTVTGENFGDNRGESLVHFGQEKTAGSYPAWSNASVSATVPTANDGKYSVYLTVDGVESNALTFTMRNKDIVIPVIASLAPNAGAVGRYVSIAGTNFGDAIGSVRLVSKETGDEAVGNFEFPSRCQLSDPWQNSLVTFIVPKTFVNGESVTPGTYDVELQTQAGALSNTVEFTVTGEDVAPSVCAIDPASGTAGDAVTLIGENFGSIIGGVTFASAEEGAILAWKDSEASVVVPNGAKSGEVLVRNAAGEVGNGVYFLIGNTDNTETSFSAASYAWSFSTGAIPHAPELVVSCTDTQVSGVPNARFTDAVCVNAVVYAEFTEDMNPATIGNAVKLERCTGSGSNPCLKVEPVSGTILTTDRSFTFTPDALLETSSLYRVTVSSLAMSTEAVPLDQDAQWTFTTKSDSTGCELERVVVSPSRATATAMHDTQGYAALPVAGCIVVDANSYTWSWDINESYARLSDLHAASCSGSSCTTAEALAEGETPVEAKEDHSGISGSGEFTINFLDPYITNIWPECESACLNAEIGASFAAPMNPASLEAVDAVQIFLCGNELCTSLTPLSSATVSCTERDGECRGFTFNDLHLTPGKYYRVIVSGDVESSSGVALTRTNYGGDYSWTFRVREDGAACSVNRVSISPTSVTVNAVGDRSAFSSEAYGSADSCSDSGQRLDGFAYGWSWTDPIADENNDQNSATRVAEWYGGLTDTAPSLVAPGCTQSCTAGGSFPYRAICGDGKLDTAAGEECEDGNVTSGDGCSSSCLREGASIYGTCGNGTVERALSGAGEDCDDGNLIDGDGCSSTCLAEGSRPVSATCGNNDIAQVEGTLAGEECDDGNGANGDGCSSLCVHEGTPTLASLGGAVCGDGEIDRPAENCDDGNVVNGDGCSSRCLLEGSSVRYPSPSTCGDGKLGTGEECEDGNTKNGDGCSSKCLLEGSSAHYVSPSYCGDGVPGRGEIALCEAHAGGDGMPDPLQLASVTPEAVYEVDEATKKAVATIEVREASTGLTTTANLSLLCAATDDTDCREPETHGVGMGNCCMVRPTVTLSPAQGSELCRNAALYATFDQPMDTDSFSYTATEGGVKVTKYRMYAKLDLASNGGVCPQNHTTLAQGPKNIFLKVYNAIVRTFGGHEVSAATGDCVVPITQYSQVPQDDGTYKVYLHYNTLLAPHGSYTLVVEGDPNVQDGLSTGVRSTYGVPVGGVHETHFTALDAVCGLDALRIEDAETAHPYIFTRGDEVHDFHAVGVSTFGGIPVEVEPISGVYSWTVTSWMSSDSRLFTAQMDTAQPSAAKIIPSAKNGDATIIASAHIDADVYKLSEDSTVNGSAKVSAFLCENPWPSLAEFPWQDASGPQNSDPEVFVLRTDNGTHFSDFYCRDAGAPGFSDDLPSVNVVQPQVTETNGVIREYLFETADNSGDAIGIRVVSNPGYLSPMAWYNAQGFTGNPSATIVDGFTAVRDGRSTYVSAPNMTADGDLYSNIYIFSYNQGASESTKNIYDQLLSNVSFATNVGDITLCVENDGVTYTSQSCSSSLDCGAEETCGSVKAELRRDNKRLTDLTDVSALIKAYGRVNGACSATTGKFCSTDSECPQLETCEPIVPPLSSGTYVPAFASSVWSSWNDVLGGALNADTLPADPLNVYASCGEENSSLAAFDKDTCVDQSRGVYVCPADSYAYHYRAVGQRSAELFADLEYNGAWANPIDSNGATDGVRILVGHAFGSENNGFSRQAFCSDSVFGTSSACGDGVVGANEVCEIGQIGGAIAACDSNGDGSLDGVKQQICNSSCSGWTDNAAATCRAPLCGNGVIDAGEECDDGAQNGKYGYCGSVCTRATSFFCGDGKLAGGEVCDCGSAEVFGASGAPGSARAYGSGPGTCAGLNGSYAANPTATCAWNCAGPAAYCGDGIVTSGEECDGTDPSWAGALCSSGAADKIGQPCNSDALCGTNGVCGGAGAYAACPLGQTRVRICNDNPGDTCTYASLWTQLSCQDIGSCGDGVVDPDEECDDGNLDSTDSCTAACKLNVCGDGAIYAGEEECDEGVKNGQACSSNYGSTCTSCSKTCRNIVSSGQFCGDGVRNGTEFCDASAIPYTYFDDQTMSTSGTCSVLGSTNGNFTCRDLGICNGGPNNGAYCTDSNPVSGTDVANCGGYECVKPTCSQSCTSACPFNYANTDLLLTANQPGSRPNSSVLLYDYDASSTSQLPNAATLTVPACSAVGSFVGNINLDHVDFPDVYVAFVLDRSSSMNTTLDQATGDSRFEVAQDALTTSVQKLYDELGGIVHIGLVGYAQTAGTGLCNNGSPDALRSCENTSQCGPYTCEDVLGFIDESDEQTAVDRIADFVSQGPTTKTDLGILSAKSLLDGVTETENVRKIIVLLSDGQPASASAATEAANEAKRAGYELYTIALASPQSSVITTMRDWSSNTPGEEVNMDTGIDYAYDGDTASELRNVYQSIVDSIIGVTVALISSDNGHTYISSATLLEGANKTLPWPEGFRCDGVHEQHIPIQITFGGKGQIELSNVRLQYCAP